MVIAIRSALMTNVWRDAAKALTLLRITCCTGICLMGPKCLLKKMSFIMPPTSKAIYK
jgi:hypothetical protein